MLAPVPTPIGVGPQFRPQPGVHARCTRAPLDAGPRVHIELFARGRVIIVPAAIGVRAPRIVAGRVVGARCRARIWTVDPTGVTRFAQHSTLADVFAVWGRRLTSNALLSFPGAVRVYRNGPPCASASPTSCCATATSSRSRCAPVRAAARELPLSR